MAYAPQGGGTYAPQGSASGGSTVVSKTIQSELIAMTSVAANLQSTSSTLNVSGYAKAAIFIDHGRDNANAFVGAGTEYRIEASEKSSGNDTWRTVYSVVCDITAPSSIVTDNSESAGATRIECGATVPSNGDIVFFKNSTLANSEWSKVVARDTTGGSEYFDIQDGLTNAQASGTYYNKAEQFVLDIDLANITRIRVICNNNNGTTNRAIVWRCACITST